MPYKRLLEAITVPLQGEHFPRGSREQVRAEGFEIREQERFTLGLVERVVARKLPTSA